MKDKKWKIAAILCASMCVYFLWHSFSSTDYNIEKAIVLPGGVYKASTIAYVDFSENLRINDASKNVIQAYMRNINNYSIRLSKVGQVLTVEFRLIRKEEHEILGGGGMYKVDLVNFKILEKTYPM